MCNSGPIIMEFTGLSMFPTMLKQVAFRIHSYSANYLEAWRVGARLNQLLLFDTVFLIARIYVSWNQGFEKEILLLSVSPSRPLRKYWFIIFCWPRSFGSRAGSACAWNHNKHSIEVGAQTYPCPLWASDAIKTQTKE